MPMPTPGAWRAPEPRELPQLRQELAEWTGTNVSLMGLMNSINQGKTSMLPVVPDAEKYSLGAVAAPLMAAAEQKRLSQATLWYASADMTSLALAAAQTPPKEPINDRRLPSESGFMVFEEPIGGYRISLDYASGEVSEAGPDFYVDTPIVAVSWSRWNPHMIDLVDAVGHEIHWLGMDIRGPMRVEDDFEGVWITFYSATSQSWESHPPDTVVGRGAEGEPITARDMARSDQQLGVPSMTWDNEYVMRWGTDLSDPPTPDTTVEWVHVVYTAWQLMTQSGKTPLSEVEDLPAPRPFRRREQRLGRPTPDGVRVVRLHTKHRPEQDDATADAARSSGRRAPHYTCRWPVRPFRKSVCGNPRKHADGGCEHYDKVIPAMIRGPKDAPLRLPKTVKLWDSQPGEDEG